ncbi:MAG TPA: hypothetical protein G4O00_12835 [Thermoflexia bacterium]|nr:hypothetical protein [Thermoflexia bacterium]
MNWERSKRVAVGIAVGGVLLLGVLLCLSSLSGELPAAYALPATLTPTPHPGPAFVKPGGTGLGCTQSDPCGSIQYAIDYSHPGYGDVIYVAGGVYTGTGGAVITITKNVTLYGGWDGSPTGPVVRDPDIYATVLDGEGVRRGVYITGTVAPFLEGLTISDGNAAGLGGYYSTDAGGGLYIYKASPVVSNCIIINNTATTGGGLFLQASNARLENSEVISNTASWGGGVRAISGSPVFRHSRFLSNTANYGGGIYVMWTNNALIDRTYAVERLAR